MIDKFNVNIYKRQKKDPVSAFYTNILTYALFPNDNAVSQSIIENWQYEWYMFDFLNRNQIDCEGKTIIDIGANNGNFSIDFAHLVGKHGFVHSFEPQRIIYYQLCANIFLNGLDNVYCHNVAIGDKEAEVHMPLPNYHEKGDVNFGDVRIGEYGDTINQRTLDSYNLKDVAFIKIDVQGYESFVVDGAKETIKNSRPYLFVEFEDHLLQPNGSSEEKLKMQIKELNYVVKPFQEGVPYQSYSGKCLDYVCIPNEKYNEFKHIIP